MEAHELVLWELGSADERALSRGLLPLTLLDSGLHGRLFRRLPVSVARELSEAEAAGLREELCALGADVRVFPHGAFHRELIRIRTEDAALEELVARGTAFFGRAGLPPERARSFLAAWREALTNAVLHGNGGQRERWVEAVLARTPARVCGLVRDEGSGFDFAARLAAARASGATGVARDGAQPQGYGGLGLLMMERGTERLRFLGKGNAVRLESSAGEQ